MEQFSENQVFRDFLNKCNRMDKTADFRPIGREKQDRTADLLNASAAMTSICSDF